jgi:hypothetical protein
LGDRFRGNNASRAVYLPKKDPRQRFNACNLACDCQAYRLRTSSLDPQDSTSHYSQGTTIPTVFSIKTIHQPPPCLPLKRSSVCSSYSKPSCSTFRSKTYSSRRRSLRTSTKSSSRRLHSKKLSSSSPATLRTQQSTQKSTISTLPAGLRHQSATLYMQQRPHSRQRFTPLYQQLSGVGLRKGVRVARIQQAMARAQQGSD